MKAHPHSARFRAVSLSILLTGATLFLAPVSSHAQMTCQQVFQTTVAYGQLRPDFEHNTHYSNEVLFQSDVKDQCNLGTCHLHAWVSSLEHDYKDNHGGNEIKLSMHYLTASYWLEQSLKAISNNDNNIVIDLGSNGFASRDFILRAGLMPAAAWTPTTSFQEGAKASRLNEALQNIIARTKWQRDNEIDPKKKNEIIAEGQKQVINVFSNFIGKFSDTFEFNGKTYTTQEFASTFFPQLQKKVVLMAVVANPQTKVTNYKNQTFIQTNIDQIEKTMREVIDHYQNVFLGYDHKSAYMDAKTGIMSIAAFETPEAGLPLSAIQKQYFSIPMSGHAVQVVGYDLDPRTNKVIKWKIKNSWGTKTGDHGYFHMYDDYFRHFSEQISFNESLHIPLPAANAHDPQQLQLGF